MTDWDARFLSLAKHISTWSKDPSTQVGAVIVDDKRRIVGMGYNGFPRGVPDHVKYYEDRDIKYSMVVHAETNAILNSNTSVDGCTIYIWPLFSCQDCAKAIIQSGISKVVSPSRGVDKYAVSGHMYHHAGVETVIHDKEITWPIP